MNGFETAPGNMRIDLCRGNIGVTEKLLDHSQVRTALQKMGRKRMPKRMGCDHFSDTGKPRVFFDHLPHELTRQSLPAPTQEKMIRLGLQF